MKLGATDKNVLNFSCKDVRIKMGVSNVNAELV